MHLEWPARIAVSSVVKASIILQSMGGAMSSLWYNLDDVAQTVLMNMANADIERTLRLAPHTATPVDGLSSYRSVALGS